MRCSTCGGDGSLRRSLDAVGGVVVDTARFRAKLSNAVREVDDAANRLATAVAELRDAARLLDPPEGVEVADPRLRPRDADSGDLRRAREAQERRRTRAAASGDWTEVTG